MSDLLDSFLPIATLHKVYSVQCLPAVARRQHDILTHNDEHIDIRASLLMHMKAYSHMTYIYVGIIQCAHGS
jgi:hypothetical protein